MEYKLKMGLGGGDFYLWKCETERWMRPACCKNSTFYAKPSMTQVWRVSDLLKKETESSFRISDAESVFCQSVLTEINVRIQYEGKEEYVYPRRGQTIQKNRMLLGVSDSAAKKLNYNSKRDERSNSDFLYVGLIDYWHGWASEYTVETEMEIDELKDYIQSNIKKYIHTFVFGKYQDDFIVGVELQLNNRLFLKNTKDAKVIHLWDGTPETTSGKGKEYLVVLPFGKNLEGKEYVEKVRKRSKVEWIR